MEFLPEQAPDSLSMYFFWLILMLVLNSGLQTAIAQPIAAPDTGSTYQIPVQLLSASSDESRIAVSELLDAQTDQRRIADVHQLLLQGDIHRQAWQPKEQAPPTHNRFNETLWFHQRLQWDQPQTSPRLLTLNWAFYTLAEIWICEKECIQLSALQEQYPHQYGPTIPLVFELPPASAPAFDLYLKLRTSGKMAVPLTVWTTDAFWEYHTRLLLMLGAFFGILLIMLLYNLILSSLLHDEVYVWYAGYVVATMIYALSLNGVGRAFLWGDIWWTKEHLIGVSACASMGLALQFYRSILDTDSWHTPLARLTKVIVWFWLLLALLQATPLARPVTTLWDFTALITMPLTTLLGICAWRKGNPTGLYLTIGWLLMSVASIVTIMGLMDLYPIQSWHIALLDLGIALETALFSFALAERINREREQKQQAQEQSLRYLREAAEAREMALSISSEARNQLENQVERRTRELRIAMSRLETLNITLEARSRMDGLTGLANRRHLDDCLKEAVLTAQHRHWHLSVIMGDIDHFKRLNDEHGHSARDACLIHVAGIWQQILNHHAQVIARYGGEEFVAILPGVHADKARQLAMQLRLAIAHRPCHYQGQSIDVTMSLGVFTDANRTHTEEQILRAVDKALYDAKHGGRNCVRIA